MAYQSKEDLFCVQAVYQAIKPGDASVSQVIISPACKSPSLEARTDTYLKLVCEG